MDDSGCGPQSSNLQCEDLDKISIGCQLLIKRQKRKNDAIGSNFEIENYLIISFEFD